MLQSLLSLLPAARHALSVRLSGVNGFTGHGEIRYVAKEDGAVMTASLKRIAGRRAEIFADGQCIAGLMLRNGRANAVFSCTRGHKLPVLQEGARIDVIQNGDVVLSGVLTRN